MPPSPTSLSFGLPSLRMALFTALLFLGFWGGAWSGTAAADPMRKSGALVHVPAYSHIYQGARNKPFLLTVILTVRNVDPVRSMTLESIQYYDGDGKHLEAFDVKQRTLAPLATLEVVIDESDKRGGAGAGFLVRWKADPPAAPPLVETVMVSTTGGQGISFVCRGEEVPGD